jgi:hypothetical protein
MAVRLVLILQESVDAPHQYRHRRRHQWQKFRPLVHHLEQVLSDDSWMGF